MNPKLKAELEASAQQYEKLLRNLTPNKRRILVALARNLDEGGLTFEGLQQFCGMSSEIAYPLVQAYIQDGAITNRTVHGGTLKQKRYLHITGLGLTLIGDQL